MSYSGLCGKKNQRSFIICVSVVGVRQRPSCKRHGTSTLAGFEFDFRDRPRFPSRKQVNREYLLVDKPNNLTDLAEDPETVLSNVRRKLDTFDASRLEKMLADSGLAKTRRVFRQLKADVHA